MGELKPCPFCGSTAEFKFNGDYYAQYEHTFECINKDCGVIMPIDATFDFKKDKFVPHEKYIERWNRRILCPDLDF